MKRALVLPLVALAIALAGATGTAFAQEKKFEVAAGLGYDLFNSTFYVESSPAWHLRFDWYFDPRFAVGLYYEGVSGQDDLIENGGYDVSLDFYGVRGTWLLGTDPAFQMLILAGLGSGSMDYNNPEVNDKDVPDGSDIKYWYEAGAGVQFAAGQRWRIRLDVTFRRFTPDEPCLLYRSGRAVITPAAEVAFRF